MANLLILAVHQKKISEEIVAEMDYAFRVNALEEYEMLKILKDYSDRLVVKMVNEAKHRKI